MKHLNAESMPKHVMQTRPPAQQIGDWSSNTSDSCHVDIALWTYKVDQCSRAPHFNKFQIELLHQAQCVNR